MRRAWIFALALCACSGAAPVNDAGSDARQATSDAGEWPPLPECRDSVGTVHEHEVMEGQSGSVRARLWRCPTSPELFVQVYRADRFELTFDGTTHRVTSGIEYQNTQHNWQDSLEAPSGDLILKWRDNAELAVVRQWVSATDRNGAVVLAETEITP